MANLATIPDRWSRLAVMRLTQNSVALPLVNRQYSQELAQEGQTVKAYRVANRKIRRKTGTGAYTKVDTVTEGVDVKLNQLFYDSTRIYAHEQSLSMADLIRTHLDPMIDTIVRGVDRVILGQAPRFLHQGSPLQRAGKLRGMTANNCYQSLLEANEVLNKALVPSGNKALVVDPATRTILKLNPLFVSAEQRGDGGAALRGTQIGTIDDFTVLMSHNASNVSILTADAQTGTVNNSPGGYAAGYASTITTTDPGANPVVGEYLVFEENGQPTYCVTGTTGGTTVQLNEALKYAITHGSAFTHYLKCVNEAVERAAGYQEEMTFTHLAGKNLQVGQILSFGTGGSRHTYTVIEIASSVSTTTTVLLDRPLDATVASGADAFPGPAGSVNTVWHPDALAFVSRPMHTFGNQFGAMESVFAANGLGVTITMQHNSDYGAIDVNLSLLAGIAELNNAMGTTVLG